MKMLRLSLRELLMLMLIVVLALGWCMDRTQLTAAVSGLKSHSTTTVKEREIWRARAMSLKHVVEFDEVTPTGRRVEWTNEGGSYLSITQPAGSSEAMRSSFPDSN